MINIKIPEGISAEVDGATIRIKGSLGQNSRIFNSILLKIKVENNSIILDYAKEKRIEHMALSAERSMAKEISNDIQGVSNHFEKMMTITYAHFPMVVESKNDAVVIKNMLGERDVRYAKIVGDTKVEIKGQNVRVYGTKLDDVAQTAANIRTSTKVRHKDIRVFQDGIYYALEE